MNERKSEYGQMFTDTMYWQPIYNRVFKMMAGVTASLGTANYFITPEERLQHTVLPYAGAVALLAANHLLNVGVEKMQDTLILHGLQDFDQESDQ